MKYCPFCFKVHTYIEEKCSVCGVKLAEFPIVPFLSLAVEKVVVDMMNSKGRVVLVQSRGVGKRLVRLSLIRMKWYIRMQKYLFK